MEKFVLGFLKNDENSWVRKEKNVSKLLPPALRDSYAPAVNPLRTTLDARVYSATEKSIRVKVFISLRVRKCGFTHASHAEIRIFTPRDIKFRTILVRKNVFLTSVITSLAFGWCCKLTLVRKRFIALVS